MHITSRRCVNNVPEFFFKFFNLLLQQFRILLNNIRENIHRGIELMLYGHHAACVKYNFYISMCNIEKKKFYGHVESYNEMFN